MALKTILAGQLADETDVKRFRSEAEAAANLDHPGIVPIYEVGEHEGQHYFSMGYIEGQSLAQRLIDGPLPPREAAALLLEVAEAIAHAHRRGVIHRDLKPSNILIDADGYPRVTDFGLAKRVQTDSGLTRSGQIMGTPSYMPPEQAAGKRGEVGPPADIYALGATLYAMIIGRPPFQAATAMDTVLQVLNDEPVPPRRLDATIPRDLETICLKCLEKVPGKRYAGAAGLGEDLRRFLAGEPILRAGDAVGACGQVGGAAAGDRRAARAGRAGGGGGLGGVLWQWREAVVARGIAERESERAKAQTEAGRAGRRASEGPGRAGRQRLYDVRMTLVPQYWEGFDIPPLAEHDQEQVRPDRIASRHVDLSARHAARAGQLLDEQLPGEPGRSRSSRLRVDYWRRKIVSGRSP